MRLQERQSGALRFYQSDIISGPHGFSTRLGGVSTGSLASLNLGLRRGDTRENLEENFARFGKAVGFDPRRLVCASQVHGDHIRTVTAEDWGKGLDRPADYEADGLITNVPGTALMVFSADCGTVLLEDPDSGAVGVCHAGWRGTALGIAGKTVRAMAETYGCDPARLRAALGPCIGACCFETDRDVPQAMLAALGKEAEPAITRAGEKYHVDLKYLNRLFLLKAGVLEAHMDVSPLCTACAPETFWSHRRHGDSRGSLGAAIAVREAP